MYSPPDRIMMSGSVASAAITLTTLVLLIVSTHIVLTRLRVWEHSSLRTPAWARRGWLAAALVAPAVTFVEPIRANFEFGQINVVLMTLVIADCVPRRTPWPRGLLLGLAIAVKLTPAVFLLYFLLRRDVRALLVTTASALAATHSASAVRSPTSTALPMTVDPVAANSVWVVATASGVRAQ